LSDWESYFYPGTTVLKNKLGIRDSDHLAEAERELVRQRMSEGVPEGHFDLDHLKAIHRHLFQDVYEWAGELRTVDMYKYRQNEHMPHNRIEMGIADVHARLEKANFLKKMDAGQFSAKAAEIVGDVNYAHPFREGNTRTQLQYLKQLGEHAGHPVDLKKIDRDAWTNAKIHATDCNYDPMRQAISGALAERDVQREQQTEGRTQDNKPVQGSKDSDRAAYIAQEKEVARRRDDTHGPERDFEDKSHRR
jgi:cell filamentation protein